MARTDEALDRWANAASHLWLFLDYDGTLADFSITPDLVEVMSEVIRVLEALAARPRLRVAVVSGRTLKIVRQLLPVDDIYLAGVYGLEVQAPGEPVTYREDLGRIRPTLDQIKPRWKELLAGKPGFFLEDKGWTLAIHADKAGRTLARPVLASARQLAEAAGLPAGLFRWFVDDVFLEIAPLKAHKGKAVEYFLRHYPLPDSRLIYIGDDDKDEEAFGPVHAFGGVNILVSQRSHSVHFNDVDYVMNSPSAVRAWLGRLLEEASEPNSSQPSRV